MSEPFNYMKSKLCILTLVGLVASGLAAIAQSTPPAGDPTPVPSSAPSSNDPSAPAATPGEAPATPAPATPEPAKGDATSPTPAPANGDATTPTPEPAKGDATTPAAPVEKTDATTPAVTPETPVNSAPLVAAAESPAGAAASSNAAPAAIQMIVMDDVPLTDAIKNLARQAGLNYMLDPKVPYGQMGADGKMNAQPSVSIRWENVTSEQALAALLNNYNLQLVEDPKSKISRVTVKDPAAPDPLVTKVVQLKFASPTNIMSAIQNTLTDKRSKVVADIRTSQLVILATEKEMIDVDQLVTHLDTRTKQVLIEARLLESQMNPGSVKGIDWTGTVGAQKVSFGNGLGGSLLANTAAGLTPSTFFLNADGVHAVISFLNTYAETKVISAPRTVTLDNETASIEVGTMFPIVNVTAGTANTTGGSSISYSNLTVKLDVTPRISANNYVNLKVLPKILRRGDAVVSIVGDQKNSVDSFLKRELQTTVLIPSGNTLVMGGLIEDNVHNENTKVPVLGDLPGVGLLFRYDVKRREKSNLTVFVTPTIVQDEDFQPTTTGFLKTPVPATDSIEEDWSAWDSGKPRDWHKDAKEKSAKKTSDDGGNFTKLEGSNAQ